MCTLTAEALHLIFDANHIRDVGNAAAHRFTTARWRKRSRTPHFRTQKIPLR
ncbi:hypothetical protein SCLCIDRAFT_1207069 [Scleroderma citrinum Foug A]|uniref:Uncharacterized protein n=1 Tax=Scleroderma citrinum Foug A TaxID=1036808 RepID=A0A0C3ERY6_9AGAM|nr:hypothetical protein SCLCIDRAFT_1207069 [Scleroderma citrinum Foug A]